MTASVLDLRLMRAALALARRGLGNVWPNPAVGCVVVRDGRVIGRGWTQPGGRPHAEAEALARAGGAARGATAYVTLEPCGHWGRTPPCADALIEAGLARVVVAIEDPDPRVAGGGLQRLRAAGIAVETGLCAEDAADINAGFLTRLRLGRPLVTLKLATSLDGRIATASGESRWITGEPARERAHLLRATHDAILVGTDTVVADDPQLTCRLPGLARHSPVRVVLDRQLRVPSGARVFAEARQTATWVVTLAAAHQARQEALREAGVVVIAAAPDPAGRIDVGSALARLGERGLTRLLVEGGGRLAAALLRAALVDRLVWFHAPVLLGGDGIPAVGELGRSALAEMPGFERLASETVGPDVMTTFRARQIEPPHHSREIA
ncbi:MAG: bifunctional diaminohydroxyphosphoribosylaminopyrimidine deaminase/5-amino-6-(5-phosphoribosylamino)uracil reductase RibD [Alphaproteobacteria bacterium]